MAEYPVVRTHQGGIDILIVMVDPSFAMQSKTTQTDFTSQLKKCAKEAGLVGEVVLVWQSPLNGEMMHIRATPPHPIWTPFLDGLTITWVKQNCQMLICG